MRTFIDKEKELIEIINKSNGKKFQSLFASKIVNTKIKINFSKKSIELRYKTKSFCPDKEEEVNIRIQSNELIERIYLAVTLVNYFEKLGLISLFRNQNINEITVLGDSLIEDNGLISDINDETLKELLFVYTDKMLLVNSEFNEFVSNGYISNDEKRQRNSLKAAWYGVYISIAIGLISSIFSFATILNHDIRDFNADFNNNVLNQNTFNKKIDSLININLTLSNKFDSLLKNETLLIHNRTTTSNLKDKSK